MKHVIRRLTTAAVAIALAFGALGAPSALAHAEEAAQSCSVQTEHRTLRVGWPIQKGLTETDGQGNHSGYTYDYLEQVAQYTGWEYEYVQVEGDVNTQLATMLDMLQRGEIDLMGAMTYNDTYAEKYDYIINPYGTAHTALLASEGNEDLSDTNIYQKEKLRVAFNGPSPKTTATVQTFCEMNGIQLEAIHCDDVDAQINAVEAGEADVLAGVDISPLKGMHVVSTTTPSPFYFATTKGNEDIVSTFNEAIVQIGKAEPSLQGDLYAKYFDSYGNSLGLSKDMRDFVSCAGAIRVGFRPGDAPIQDLDAQTGQPVGATKAVLDFVAEYTGLAIEMVPVSGDVDWDRAIEEYDLDALAGIVHDFDFADEHGLSLSTAYLTSNQWIVVRDDVNASDLEGKRLALTRGVSFGDVPEDDVVICDTLQDCIAAVSSGRADYTYANGYSAPYYLNMDSYRNITTFMNTDAMNNICFAFAPEADSALLRVFNESIREMPVGTVNNSIYGAIMQSDRMTISRFVEAYAKEIVVLGLLIAAVIIVLSVLYARSRSKALALERAEKERLKTAAEQDDLTGLLGVGALREAAQELADRNELGAFVVVDIDDFKDVNDTYGHKAGDEALCLVARKLEETFREGDLISRFGGDEFAVCLKGLIGTDALKQRCQQLLEGVKAASEEAGCPFTVSIGAVRVSDSEGYLELYDLADKAMYHAKRSGKGRFVVD